MDTNVLVDILTSPGLFLVSNFVAVFIAAFVSIHFYRLILARNRRGSRSVEVNRVELEEVREFYENQIMKLHREFITSSKRWEEAYHLIMSSLEESRPAGLPEVPALPFLKRNNVTDFDLDMNLVFVLMPFADSEYYVYSAVNYACDDVGYRCSRGDEDHVTGDVFQNILERIVKARVVVANINGKNPNVFFELGICQAIGKKVIYVANRIEYATFDIQNDRILTYTTQAELRDLLRYALLKIKGDDERLLAGVDAGRNR